MGGSFLFYKTSRAAKYKEAEGRSVAAGDWRGQTTRGWGRAAEGFLQGQRRCSKTD